MTITVNLNFVAIYAKFLVDKRWIEFETVLNLQKCTSK